MSALGFAAAVDSAAEAFSEGAASEAFSEGASAVVPSAGTAAVVSSAGAAVVSSSTAAKRSVVVSGLVSLSSLPPQAANAKSIAKARRSARIFFM